MKVFVKVDFYKTQIKLTIWTLKATLLPKSRLYCGDATMRLSPHETSVRRFLVELRLDGGSNVGVSALLQFMMLRRFLVAMKSTPTRSLQRGGGGGSADKNSARESNNNGRESHEPQLLIVETRELGNYR